MKPQDYIDRLSTHLKQVIARAIGTATAMAHSDVSPAHLLLALSEEQGSVGFEILKKIDFTSEHARTTLGGLTPLRKKAVAPTGGLTTALPELSTEAKKALEKAMLLAYDHEHNYIGTEHLLHGLIELADPIVEAIFAQADITAAIISKEVQVIIESTNRFPDMEDIAATIEEMQDMISDAAMDTETPLPEAAPSKKVGKKKKRQSALETFAVDLTCIERQERIDPVIGRKDEIERMVHILARRNKNNPVLVGEAGVGKTAIVEGLAKRIVEGDVPPVLRTKKIYALDLTLLISGTIYRGEFESRIKKVMEEVAEDEHAILFIDEIHNIIGAGSNQGTMDAANILKPALARGELNCIGATTLDEYHKHISADPALARRFQSIFVKEPTEAEAKDILFGVSKYYEAFHGVRIQPEAITAAVEMSTKYIHDNFLPDKAIDLIDEASAAVRVAKVPTEIDEQLHTLKASWDDLQQQKEEAILAEEFDTAMTIKEQIEHVETALASATKEQKELASEPSKLPVVDQTHIAAALGLRIGQPAERLLEDEWELLAALPARLGNTVIGQSKAIDQTVEALKKGFLGIGNTKRPIASLLYTGPSGTGKSKLAKELATALYHDDASLVRLDMTEFAEAHGVSKLLGSPAGYVGFNERNKFLDTVRTRPYSVVLFDEFDKAHPDVRKLLLQILDEGSLTDSTGRKISFMHTVVVLTSNTGGEHMTKGTVGFGQDTATGAQSNNAVMAELRESFGSELLGRLNSVCVFTPLSGKHIATIIEQHVRMLSESLASSRDLSIEIDPKATEQLAAQATSLPNGVRSLEQQIDTIVQDLVIQKLQQARRKKSYTLTTSKQTFKLV